jgi:glycosyltransferase involved in cell wall biosynthesis
VPLELPSSIASRLPDLYVLYPAQTWPHKNHLGLIDGLHELRARGVKVPLVCTGQTNEFQGRIMQRVREFDMDDQVVWLGFVAAQALPAIYRRATAVVIPTKFEAASGPLWEAFEAGVPAACSNVTSLPEQAGDAALIFDPDRPSEIAGAVARLWTDADLRATLAARGRRRVESLSWERTARIFRAHYRRLAGRTLDDADRDLLRQPAYP